MLKIMLAQSTKAYLQPENNQAKKTESREGFIIIYLFMYLFSYLLSLHSLTW